MPGRPSAVVQKQLEVRSKALAANSTELAPLEPVRQQVDATLAEMKDLTARQLSLTAAKQEVSKRLTEVNTQGQKLVTYVDVAIRNIYGSRSEKLVEFGQQPFRSQPRLKVVGVDGKPLRPKAASEEAPATSPTE